MTETIDKAEFLRLARAAGFYHYDMPDVEGQDLGQSLEADGRGAVDRLVASLQAHITDRLAAAEARNATLTDDAARAERNRDMWKDQCAAQAQQIAQARAEAVQVKVLHETIIDAARRAMDEGEDALDTINVPSHHAAALSLALDDYDAAIQSRAAASISTKEGDTHAD